MNPIVVDCSVSAAWCLQDEASPAAERLLERVIRQGALVPAIWPSEMANVLVTAERRGRITAADAERAVELLERLPIRIDSPYGGTLSRCRAVAREYGLTAYDASYLDLAFREGLELATFDERLAEAARRAGVPLASEA